MKSGKALTPAALKSFPLPLVVDGDKETKGRILVIAGSRQVAGAALLTATAAMRAGAGKLRMISVEGLAVPTALAMPEAMVGADRERARTRVTNTAGLLTACSRAVGWLTGPGSQVSWLADRSARSAFPSASATLRVASPRQWLRLGRMRTSLPAYSGGTAWASHPLRLTARKNI